MNGGVLFTTTLEGFSLVPRATTPSGRRTKRVKDYEKNQQVLAMRLRKVWGDNEAIPAPVSLSFAVHKAKGNLTANDARSSLVEALVAAGIISESSLIASCPVMRVFLRDGTSRVVVSLKGNKQAVSKKGQLSLLR